MAKARPDIISPGHNLNFLYIWVKQVCYRACLCLNNKNNLRDFDYVRVRLYPGDIMKFILMKDEGFTQLNYEIWYQILFENCLDRVIGSVEAN